MRKKVVPQGWKGSRIAREIAQGTASVIEWERQKVLEAGKQNEDTKIRRQINEFILAKAFEGRNKEDILKRLMFIFHAERYKPYWKFFEVWVDGAIQKRTQKEDVGEKKEKVEKDLAVTAKTKGEDER